ncbi:permease [Sphingobacterium mizutaii NBRC 14946 = DSM 11724]|uniref:Predicted permease, DMT superfamily n=2 Tax=Sphingobacterium mizutaii TaxID=1010 RepID=A0AAJ4X9T0_9SPHI|nr:EamA family transporter [Sphingobacterium mizutaii]GEM67716.1 permease [Sphingobacterium mizutaii NBRC 14946 = DSM 11724]SDL70559.1 Threonine/homoserine efflux transporter RhtA [Sphingobacterium mizutaii]SNV41800.1 Predicted permease, DMT superfamily [Sphingobacterium mizutaii]
MSQLTINRNTLILHFTVLIWGFTGVLGELITVSALHLVWYRVLIAAVSLVLYYIFTKRTLLVPKDQLLQYLGVGMIVGLHWVLFFHAIKVSTVSVTLVTLSSVTLFTALLEPIINRKRISIADVIVGLVIIFGIYLIFKFEFKYFWGIVYGLSCAFCASIFSILNARMVKKGSPTTITLYEMVGAWIGVSFVMFFTGDFDEQMILSQSDLLYLLLLGVVCTAIAYVLGVAVMRELSAFTVALTTNMEPVYGIILALLIFGQKEAMSTGFYFGAVIVLAAVFVYPYLKTKIKI